jgi:hypothetical protein
MELGDESFQVWADADFSGNWDKDDATTDPDTARSRSGYVITYLGAPIMWKSQLQGVIACSTCEAEYVCLSQALRRVLPIMELVKEMKALGYNVGSTKPEVKCKLFEDNSGAIALANAPAMRPRTKHINIAYHHFRTHIGNTVDITYVDTLNQLADMLTKPNNTEDFLRHRRALMGW